MRYAPIANPEDYDWCRELFVFAFDAYSSTRVYAYANGVEDALEKAAGWLADNAPGVFTDEPESEDEETDLTYTESGWLCSWEWCVGTVSDPLEKHAINMRSWWECEQMWGDWP